MLHLLALGALADDDIVDLSLRRHESIPTVDLSRAESEVVAALAAACEYPGFFFLSGLPDDVAPVADAALDAARAFFQLPEAEKRALANDRPELQYHVVAPNGSTVAVAGTGNGWRARGADAHFARDARESFNVGRAAPPPRPEGRALGRYTCVAAVPDFADPVPDFAELQLVARIAAILATAMHAARPSRSLN